MSKPRSIEPGKTYLVTRRTLARFFLLRPDQDGMMTRLFIFWLSVLALAFGMRVHAVTVMSTHFHMVVTDVEEPCRTSSSASTP